MKKPEKKRFEKLYQPHKKTLKLQGKAEKTIDAYSRAIRRVTKHFDCCPDKLKPEQLEDYFAALVESHSWSTVKIDRLGPPLNGKNNLEGQGTFSFRIPLESKKTNPLRTPLNKSKLPVPKGIISQWIVDCAHVGKGITALKYLSRYLYRGVIGEKNIASNQNGRVTFTYVESKTGDLKYRTLKGEAFLRLIVQHVLPKGFRRVRDYGFLHSNAKKLLSLVQLILHINIKSIEARARPAFICPCCKSAMRIIYFRLTAWESG